MNLPVVALLVASTGTLVGHGPGAYPPRRTLDLEGFATLGAGTSGGGRPEPGDVARYKVIDAATPSPARALQGHLEGEQPVVVELRTDVDLGALDNHGNPPLMSPELIRSRVGTIRVGSNKTLFSVRGATLRHGTFDLDGSRNVILRNLRFRGLWEWDEATRGEYDRQGWDFVVLRGARNVWIDHCDFGKAYDGPLDIVRGSDLVTVSWTRFAGDLDGEVERQVAHLEALYQADPADVRIAHYRALRDRWSASDIVRREVPQQKGTLVGAADGAGSTDGGRLNVTFHHDAYLKVRQRTPRMRFGNAHVYNVLVQGGAAGPLPAPQTAVNSTMGAAVLVENSLFVDVKTPLAFSTRGRLAQRGSAWQVEGRPRPFDADRLEPQDADDLVFNPPRDFAWPDRRRLPYAYRLDAVGDLRDTLQHVGVIVPASAADEARLRRDLLGTRH
jgi:pectate lyase